MKATTIARWILGLIFFIFGLNGFLNFLPQPQLPPGAMAYLGGLLSAGYFFPVLKATEVLVGLFLLAGVAIPVALVVLAPISIQIFLFHAFLTPGLSNLVLPVVILALHVTAASAYWHLYLPLFVGKALPSEKTRLTNRSAEIPAIV